MQTNSTTLSKNSELRTNLAKNSTKILVDKNERLLVDEFNEIIDRSDQVENIDSQQFLTHGYISKYDIRNEIFDQQRKNITALYELIIQDFEKDKTEMMEALGLSEIDLINIEVGEGDFHDGKSTAIVKLLNDVQLVYKPNSGKITTGFHNFLDWVNHQNNTNHHTYKILDKGHYHWLEFVKYVECQSEEELALYYQRCGVLLAVIYALNGCDFHYENVIAHGAYPVVIDHETVIQPKVDPSYLTLFKSRGLELQDTVYGSMLLPNQEVMNTMPSGMCGFGWHKQTRFNGLTSVGMNRFTKDWKVVADFFTYYLYKNNIPMFNGEKVYPYQYLNQLIEGFESTYQLLLEHRNLLVSSDSPLKSFDQTRIRYIWRPTSVYAKILKKVRLPQNLKDKKNYEESIRYYLSKAFKNVSKESDLWLIYEHEVTQMLRGDIPFFEMDSSSHDLITEHGRIKNFFELNAVENIHRKLNKLSPEDLEYQKNLIKNSIFG